MTLPETKMRDFKSLGAWQLTAQKNESIKLLFNSETTWREQFRNEITLCCGKDDSTNNIVKSPAKTRHFQEPNLSVCSCSESLVAPPRETQVVGKHYSKSAVHITTKQTGAK